MFEELGAVSSVITIGQFAINRIKLKKSDKNNRPIISVSIDHDRKYIILRIANHGPILAKNVRIRCPESDYDSYCDKLQQLFRTEFDLPVGGEIPIPFRPMFLGTMKEMLDGYVPDKICLTVEYQTNDKNYKDEASISIDILELMYD